MLEKVIIKWKLVNIERPYLLLNCTQEDLENEVLWLEDQLIKVLNNNVKII